MKTLPNRFVFEEAEAILRRGGTVKLRLVGNSMFPFLRGGCDTVVIVPVSTKALRRGSVVLFRYRGEYLLHRITGQCDGLFRLCGDGVCGPGETAHPADICGLLLRVERPGGSIISCCSFRWRLSSAVWMLLRPVRRYVLAIFFR